MADNAANDSLFGDETHTPVKGSKRKSVTETLGEGTPQSVRVIAAMLDAAENSKPNKTFGKVSTLDELMNIPTLRELSSYLTSPTPGTSLRLVGSPGNAKSAVTNAMAKLAGMRTKIFPAAEMHVEDMSLPVPVRGENGQIASLKQVIYQDLLEAETVIIEELSRAHGAVQQAFMELLASWTMNGQALPHLKAIVICDNNAAQEKDGGFIKTLDAAVADRVNTVRVDDNATNWRRYLASQFPQVDLADIYRRRDLLPSQLRRRLSPRTLQHALWAVSQNLPMEWALPVVNDRRELLIDENQNDHTAEMAGAIAKAFGLPGNPKGPEGAEKLRTLIQAAVSTGKNLRIIGGPGIGKTAIAKSVIEDMGYPIIYMSGSATTPDNLFVPVPTKDGKVDIILDERFMMDQPYVLVVDEFSRCKPEVKPKFYGLLQERRLGGIDLPNLVAVIALDNPREIAGRRMDAGTIERAAADRFWATVEITASETNWADHLIRKYGEPAEIVVEWWKEVLSPEAKVHVSARCCERLIDRNNRGLTLVEALVFDESDDRYIAEEFLHTLDALFAKRAVPRLSIIVDKVDDYEASLAADKDCQRQHEVYLALLNAELKQLEDARTVCVRMMKVLHEQHSIALLRTTKEKQKFWLPVLLEARGKKA